MFSRLHKKSICVNSSCLFTLAFNLGVPVLCLCFGREYWPSYLLCFVFGWNKIISREMEPAPHFGTGMHPGMWHIDSCVFPFWPVCLGGLLLYLNRLKFWLIKIVPAFFCSKATCIALLAVIPVSLALLSLWQPLVVIGGLDLDAVKGYEYRRQQHQKSKEQAHHQTHLTWVHTANTGRDYSDRHKYHFHGDALPSKYKNNSPPASTI